MNLEESSARGRRLGVAALLALVAFALYAGAGRFEFLNYDDPDYVTQNPFVRQGLTGAGLRWAFGFHAANWHPLTWLSHMLDVELFGLTPGPMHLVNAGLHALGAALCFLAFAALTRAFWPSLLVAALFAVHPLRVQCVAWISERKELLASVCFFALLLPYARWARTRARSAYGLVVLFLALGCMAKPMLVTAPFVLLLLDAWPLARLRASTGPGVRVPAASWSTLVMEKLPLFALVALSCVLTVLAQRAGGAVAELGALSAGQRVLTAGAGLVAYLRASVWPAGLAAFYPHPLLVGGSVLVPGLVGLALALGLSLAAFALRARAPALATGWFWFLGMLVPVLGLVQVGDQAWADRYAYLPTIGLYVLLAFGLAELLGASPAARKGLGLAGFGAVAALALVTLRTLPCWRDSLALFERALAVTEGNWIAHNNAGLVYLERREMGRARENFEAAVRLRPDFVPARFNLGQTQEAARDHAGAVQSYQAVLAVRPGHPETLLRLAELARADGATDQAREFFEQAVKSNAGDARVWLAYARFLLESGDVDRAANVGASALQLDPSLADAQLVLAEVAWKRGELDEAARRLERAEALAPASSEVHSLRARLLFQKDDLAGARAEFERALTLDPNAARARHDFGTLLLRTGDTAAARAQFQALSDIRPGDPQALLGLAAVALAEKRPGEAIPLLERALEALPGFPLALINLATAHEQLGQWKEALARYQESFAAGQPDPDAACAAAWILATGPDESLLDGSKAVQLATYAVRQRAANAPEVLAAALARAEEYEQAVKAQEQALALAQRPEQKRALEERLALYRAGKPYLRPR